MCATSPPSPPTPPAPAATATHVESAEPWRNTIPGPAQMAPKALPKAKPFKLANGLTVYLVEARSLPIVAAQLAVRSGAGADPVGKAGLAAFSTAMLDEGPAKRGALAIARDLEALGATLDLGSSADGSYLTLRSLKQNASRALAIMSDVALAPSFPENEVDRVRNDRLTAILQQRDSPFQTAMRELLPALYGSDHPYGHMSIGDEAALEEITRDDLAGFYQAAFTPENAALVLAGDLTESEARKLANDAFGAWKGTGGTTPKPAAGAAGAERILVVDKAGAPQTMLLLGQVSVERSDPDYEKLDTMNQILGGLFSSRINLNLREQKGYTYGAFSAVLENRGAGPLIVGSSVRTDVTGPALSEMMKEMRGMLAAEVTKEELDMAKESIARSLPARFETTQSIVVAVGSLYMYDLAPDYYEGLPARIAALTPAEVYAATQKHLKPDQMVVVAVGDRKTIEAQVRPLKLGPLAIRTPGKSATGAAAAANP